MEDPEIFYCYECAEQKLSKWKGWPHKHPVPYLEPLEGEECKNCTSNKRLSNKRVFWVNYSPGYVALPLHWLLKIDADPVYKKWGRPYKDKMLCLKCKKPATISEFMSDRNKLKCNCEACDKVLP
ncbi:hypothetical protein [Candidatus Puniceispirillum marinum]|uniref:hypothetical protein n=1 Tax=Candidatus Puniceispirillum marinum TaxID=767892 RepID=UPI0005A428DD|nr:hypothetical protein [Candidatus Puniceispirillum marinum]